MLQSKFKQINLNAYSDVMTTENLALICNIYKGTMGLNLNVTLEWHVYCVVNVETWRGLFLNFLTSFGLSTGSTNKLKLFQTSKLLQNTVWKCWKFKVFWISKPPNMKQATTHHYIVACLIYKDKGLNQSFIGTPHMFIGTPCIACRLKMVLMF